MQEYMEMIKHLPTINENNTEAYNDLLMNIGTENPINSRFKEVAFHYSQMGGITIVGSSTIEQWNNPHSSFSGYYVRKIGVSGSTLVDIIRTGEFSVYFQNPESIVIYAGDNDFAEHSTDMIDFKIMMQTLVYNINHRLPRTKIFLISIKPSPARKICFDQYLEANKYYSQLAEDLGFVYFVDIWDEMKNRGNECFKSDLTHLNNAGYEVLSNRLREVFYSNNR